MIASSQIPVADQVRRSDTMSSRELMVAALTGKTPDRVPISFKSIDPFNRKAERPSQDPNYGRLTELARRYTDVMHDWRPNRQALVFCDAEDVRIDTKVAADGATLTTVHTPRGDLSEVKRRVGDTTWATKHFIETEDDLDIFLAIDGEPERPNLDSFWYEKQRLGDRGLMRISLSDPIGMLAPLLPRDTFYIWMVERAELVDVLHERMFERLRGLVGYMAKSRVECVFQFSGAEYAAPPMASPEMFDRHVGRFGKPITDLLHAHGCLPTLHCHSKVGALLTRFADMGYVATHPVEPPPMGDVTPAEFKARVGDRLAMIGNVQIGEVLQGDPGQIRADVRELVETFGSDGGLMISETASPWDTPMTDATLRNYLTIIEAAYEFGQAS